MELSIEVGRGIPDLPGLPPIEPLYKGVGALILGWFAAGTAVSLGVSSLAGGSALAPLSLMGSGM